MKRHHWQHKVLAFVLCLGMTLSGMSFGTTAAEVESDTETVVESAIESQSTSVDETVVGGEQNTDTEKATEETAETSINVTESAESDAAIVPGMEGETATEQVTETQVQMYTITGFAALDADDASRTYGYYSKPLEAEVIADMPQEIGVYLDGGSEVQMIPVTWTGIGGFDDTAWFYYEFDPVWDTAVYTLDTDETLPYIAVYLQENMKLRSVTTSANEEIIFEYLTKTMGFNTAAACGILANIRAESSFNPNMQGDWDGSKYTSYGICQWHNERWTSLKAYAGSAWDTLDGQLKFLNYELNNYYSSVVKILKGVSNNAAGAYTAAYYWCTLFEIPADTKNVAVTRGNLAQNVYWMYYSNPDETVADKLEITSFTLPTSLTYGSSFSIQGLITSPSKMTNVTVTIENTSGTSVISKSATPNAKTYNLSGLDSSVKFGSLSAGLYRMKVTVKNSSGTSTLVDQIFAVLNAGKTLADGKYNISLSANTAYALAVSGDSTANNANVVLGTKSFENSSVFQLLHQSAGYYLIKNVKTGLYLNVTTGSEQRSESGANVFQSTSGALWQIVPDSTGGYYLISKTSTLCCLDLSGAKIVNGQNIEIYKYNMSAAQRWTLTEVVPPPTITSANKPSTMTQGSSFKIAGKLSSNTKMTSVTAAVYDVSGNQKIGKTVTVNATSYDLSSIAGNLAFNTLTPGCYQYKVTATNSGGAEVLVSQKFNVLSNAKTVADGTYFIAAKGNTNYNIAVASNSTSSGANLCLWSKSSSAFRQYKFTYQSNGYYKVQNAGSGKYLYVSGQSASSGANVNQSSSTLLWQVLPDGTGSYYLVPNCATSNCLAISGGGTANNKNIVSEAVAMSTSQRWTLQKVSKPSISGATKPSTMTVGGSFSVRGTIKAADKVTSVTVAVYDTNGKQKIGKTVKPNATSYDLKNLDTSIKFGSLTAGCYQYKVIAANSAGSVTLVNQTFIVLSKTRTIADGTMYMKSMVNTGYLASVAHTSKADGANIYLLASDTSNFRKFKFTYQSNGYYKIRNVASGKYLSVKNSKSASGTNIIQSKTATLWQVLPDGTGSYYLIPKCATKTCMTLSSGKAAKGQNIDIETAAMSKAQRWKLQSTTATSAKAVISGATKPSAIKVGGSFSIRGTIKSSSKITSVTVGVYDKNNKQKIGKTVNPNATSYDLKKVDTSIKFGTLAAGSYKYKVTAKNSAGTVTLVNQAFTVSKK